MVWMLLLLLVQIAVIASGVRREQKSGNWSWSKFVFLLAFGAMECLIITIPIFCIDMRSRWFGTVFAGAAVIAALNFIWMIIVARRWKLPDGRTSLEAYRDEQRALRNTDTK